MKDFAIKIKELRKYAKENFVPIARDKTIMQISHLLEKEDCKNVLEIGTAIGYSGIIMLSSCNGRLTTIEKDEERFQIASDNFADFQLLDRVNLIHSDAAEVLSDLQSSNQKFDFIFLDGPKGQYIKYLPYIKNLLAGGGILFADNVLLGGLIKDETKVTHKNRTMTVNMKQFIDELLTDEDFESELFEIDDGFIIAKLKKSTEY